LEGVSIADLENSHEIWSILCTPLEIELIPGAISRFKTASTFTASIAAVQLLCLEHFSEIEITLINLPKRMGRGC